MPHIALVVTPYVLSVGNLYAMWATRKGRPVGWAILAFVQALFLVYSIVTGQYGFLPQNVAAIVLASANWRAWRRASITITEPSTEAS
jgi:hypothetical protein